MNNNNKGQFKIFRKRSMQLSATVRHFSRNVHFLLSHHENNEQWTEFKVPLTQTEGNSNCMQEEAPGCWGGGRLQWVIIPIPCSITTAAFFSSNRREGQTGCCRLSLAVHYLSLIERERQQGALGRRRKVFEVPASPLSYHCLLFQTEVVCVWGGGTEHLSSVGTTDFSGTWGANSTWARPI